jgi:aryl-alcohol dehydrogenase-like predicted oxidoreductase
VDHIDLYYQHRVDATVPIPGTTRRAHLEENVTAMGVELTPGDREELASALPPGAASGLRYPEAGMRALSL